MASATTSRPASRATLASPWSGLVSPVEVSLWVRNTMPASGLASSSSAKRAGSMGSPHSTASLTTCAP